MIPLCVLESLPIQTIQLIGWVCVALEGGFVLLLLRSRNAGDDAAGRGLATAYGALLAPIVLLVGGTLLWGTLTDSRPLIVAGALLSALPFLGMLAIGVLGMVRKASRAWVRRGTGAFDSRALTRLARAIDRGEVNTVAEMLKGARLDFTERDAYQRTLLGHAVFRATAMFSTPEQGQLVRALLEGGVPYAADAVEPDGDWASVIATNAGDQHNHILQAALEFGADPNARDPWDEQPQLFSRNMTVGKAKLLVEHGADVHALSARADRRLWSGLMNAAHEGQWEMAGFFLDHGVDPAYATPDGKTAGQIVATNASAPEGALLTRLSGHQASHPSPRTT